MKHYLALAILLVAFVTLVPAQKNKSILVEGVENPRIGIAMISRVNGTAVTYEVTLENLGDVTISNLMLSDPLNPVFGSGNYSITSQPAFLENPGTITLSPQFFGFNIFDRLITDGSLAPGARARFRFVVNVNAVSDQGNGFGIYYNQVTINGQSPDATAVSDLSDDGIDPDPNGNGNAGDAGEDDPTLTVIGEDLSVGAATTVTTNGTQGTYDIYLENLGNTTATLTSLTDDLDAFLGAGKYNVLSAPAFIDDPGTITLNNAFDGSCDKNLISNGSTLVAGATAQIRFTVEFNVGGNLKQQVLVTAQGTSGTVTADYSDDGTDPDPNGNNNPADPGEDDPSTFVLLGPQILIVNTTDNMDDGTCDAFDCSLREAISIANRSPFNDTIEFSSSFDFPQTITLVGEEIIISDNGSLTINGSGTNLLTIDAGGNSRIFTIQTGAVANINGLTIANGNSGGDSGGGISNSGTLTISDVTVRDNVSQASLGGNGTGGGGGIYNSGTLLVNNSTIRDNYTNSGGYGGGIVNTKNLTMTNSTVSGNNAVGGAVGGLYMRGISTNPTATLTNVTFSNNSAGIAVGGIYFVGGTIDLKNSIIANSGAGRDCEAASGGVVNADYSLVEDGLVNCSSGTQANNLFVDPILTPLGFYGGNNYTHALTDNSPALNMGDPVSSLATDQRGAARNDRVDIGAFEFNSAPVADLPDARTNQAYNVVIVPDNGSFTYSLAGGALPPGVMLTTNFAPQAVVALTGTPTMAGTYNFAIMATDGANSVTTNYQIDVAFAPTAAAVSVSGLISAGKMGIAGAVVSMTDGSGNTRSTRTNSFGFYRFNDVEAGQSYTMTVSSRRYYFFPQILAVNDAVENLNFSAE